MALMTAVERPGAGPVREDVLRAFHALELPEGFRAELIEGEIIVTPPPDGEHETTISDIAKQFFRLARIEIDVLPAKGLALPGGFVMPDGTVVAAGHLRGAKPWAGPEGILLVLEVTSTKPETDRQAKRLAYAAAQIPCYLLVDRGESRVTLFTAPRNGDYTASTRVAFGDPLELPSPFSFKLDTATFN